MTGRGWRPVDRESDCQKCACPASRCQWRIGGRLGHGACDRVRNSLAIAPAVAQGFELETADGKPFAPQANWRYRRTSDHRAGDIRVRVAPDSALWRSEWA